MKQLLFLFFLSIFSTSSHALPIRCFSIEEIAGEPLFQFKLSENRNRLLFGDDEMVDHLIGLTDHKGKRKIIKVNARFRGDKIYASFVGNGWLVGHMTIYNDSDTTKYRGEFLHKELDNREILIECFDEE